MPGSLQVCCLASGGGTTVAAILDAINAGRLPGVKVGLVITNKQDAGVIHKALAGGVHRNDVLVFPHREFTSPEAFGLAILQACAEREINFIGQYGWIPRTPRAVVENFVGRIVNQHPGFLSQSRTCGNYRLDFGGPKMKGRAVIAAARHFAHLTGERWHTHAVAHFVDEDIDTGLIVRAWKVPFEPGDSVEDIQKKLLPVEHAVQIATLGDAANEQMTITHLPSEQISPQYLAALQTARVRAIDEYPHG